MIGTLGLSLVPEANIEPVIPALLIVAWLGRPWRAAVAASSKSVLSGTIRKVRDSSLNDNGQYYVHHPALLTC